MSRSGCSACFTPLPRLSPPKKQVPLVVPIDSDELSKVMHWGDDLRRLRCGPSGRGQGVGEHVPAWTKVREDVMDAKIAESSRGDVVDLGLVDVGSKNALAPRGLFS